MKPVRCAIYTRKSSDEGLDQAFNSLDAQREACAAYILSQASEGWRALPDVYDDGGLSGGTLARPALQRLLADMAEDRIDIIVVYKVDRLTRSLLDFARLVEAFDKAGTSFVSITQSFNTTTSMGRLTLNMLLSFAQFEREVTAERIRDKIAASKAKGMWMGGTPPLGYRPDGRSLAIIEDHAAIVRTVFARYLDMGNVRHVARSLNQAGIGAPLRQTISGRTFGGVPLSRGQIYKILSCPTYIGEVHHKGAVYPGLHAAIIERDVWDQVQQRLASNLQGHRSGRRARSASLLAGKIVDGDGAPLSAVHACRGQTRYRYYVSQALQSGDSDTGMRIPAAELEGLVAQRIAAMFSDGLALAADTGLVVDAADVAIFMAKCALAEAEAARRDRDLIASLVRAVRIHDRRIEIDCATAALAERLGVERTADAPEIVTLRSEVRLTRTGRAMRLIQNDGRSSSATPNTSLIKLLLKARHWWRQLRTGDMDINTLGRTEGVHPAYITRVLRLAFLSPAVVDAILQGRTLPGVDGVLLTAPGAIAPSWEAQARSLLEGGAR